MVGDVNSQFLLTASRTPTVWIEKLPSGFLSLIFDFQGFEAEMFVSWIYFSKCFYKWRLLLKIVSRPMFGQIKFFLRNTSYFCWRLKHWTPNIHSYFHIDCSSYIDCLWMSLFVISVLYDHSFGPFFFFLALYFLWLRWAIRGLAWAYVYSL